MTARRVNLIGMILVLTVLPAAAQAPKDRAPEHELDPNATEMFRGLLDFHGIKPLTMSALHQQRPRKTIVIVLGQTTVAPGGRSASSLVQAVLESGGSALIATEEQGRLSLFFPRTINLDVTGERVQAPEDTVPRLQGHADCPFVRPAVNLFTIVDPLGIEAGEPSEEQTLFMGLSRVATNRPTALRPGEPRWPYIRNVLARFPPGCVDGRTGRPLPDDRAFAVGGSGRPGEQPFRCLVLADPGVFSNQMLAATDETGNPATQNLIFANSVARFLRGPDNDPKTHCLFIENGRVRSRFDEVKYAGTTIPPIPPLPIPSLLDPQFQRKLTDVVNEQVAGHQEKDTLHNRFAGSDERFKDTARRLAQVVAVLAILFFLWRMWRRRHEPDLPPVPTDTGRIAGSAPPGSIARRREEVLQTGNYTPLVQDYLRDLFAGCGLPRAGDPTPRPMPAVNVSGPEAKTLKGHLRILWDVAYGPKPRPVTYSRWKELEPMIDAVRRAADEGRWRFDGSRA